MIVVLYLILLIATFVSMCHLNISVFVHNLVYEKDLNNKNFPKLCRNSISLMLSVTNSLKENYYEVIYCILLFTADNTLCLSETDTIWGITWRNARAGLYDTQNCSSSGG